MEMTENIRYQENTKKEEQKELVAAVSGSDNENSEMGVGLGVGAATAYDGHASFIHACVHSFIHVLLIDLFIYLFPKK